MTTTNRNDAALLINLNDDTLSDSMFLTGAVARGMKFYDVLKDATEAMKSDPTGEKKVQAIWEKPTLDAKGKAEKHKIVADDILTITGRTLNTCLFTSKPLPKEVNTTAIARMCCNLVTAWQEYQAHFNAVAKTVGYDKALKAKNDAIATRDGLPNMYRSLRK